ncbi:Hypothetical predicted protein [Mytilus galloprovincialis]|uniref:Endonuclease/exonuclease/phosphatase domain-containing protein n=1 Tax=Mytilus galloprovincialis TaxID=29158 RepID=A0A8B6G2Q1_MYTGA|nr:Hypothetical predicted protein [Mytilus galloprovincialis]
MKLLKTLFLNIKRGDQYLYVNSRVGELNDVLCDDNLDKYVESVEFVENPYNIQSRRSLDSFGRKLIQLCYTTGLTVANGRLGDDSDGKFTFCTSRGRCVNDCLLVSPIDYKLISYFNVLQFNEFSDHSPLFFQLNFSNNRPQNKYHKLHKYIKWDSNKK